MATSIYHNFCSHVSWLRVVEPSIIWKYLECNEFPFLVFRTVLRCLPHYAIIILGYILSDIRGLNFNTFYCILYKMAKVLRNTNVSINTIQETDWRIWIPSYEICFPSHFSSPAVQKQEPLHYRTVVYLDSLKTISKTKIAFTIK